ncbi:MAG TPA: hypothetical protein VKC17_00210 [Sphingomicrobium sp.]|nr:hypothetical protein [Sphingomicrobium sp.]
MKIFLIAAAATAAIATQAQAAPSAQAAPPAQAAPLPGLRGNGLQPDVTRQKAQQMAGGLFQRFDVNHDGTLTRQEADQASARMGGGGAGGDRAERMIARVFGEAQSITLAQFEAQLLARFDRQDLNHDGTVTAAERQQARAAQSQQN